MKTLRGTPIEGDLLKLYQYALAPNGGAIEAMQLAEANGLGARFTWLMQEQYDDAEAIYKCIYNYATISPIVQYSKDAPAIYLLKDSTLRLFQNHVETGIYKFNVRIKVAVRMIADWRKPMGFANKEEAERLWLAGSGLEQCNLNADSLPVPFLENEHLRNKASVAAQRVAVAIQAALHELKNTPITSSDSIDARNIVVQTDLDNYPQIIYIDNVKAVFAH
jgi:hypothetical protein